MSRHVPPGDFSPDQLLDYARGLLEEPALRDVLQARLDQVLVHGHTAQSDAALPIAYFARELHGRAIRIAEDAQYRVDRALMRRRVVKHAALTLALLERLDAEAAKEANHG